MPHAGADSFEFDKLQQELESEITEAAFCGQEQLLNNFDQEVIEKVRVQAGNSRNRFEELLWRATQFLPRTLRPFRPSGHSFDLERNPFPGETIHPGPYRMGRNVEEANTYRVGHPLAQRVLECCLALETPSAELRFQLSRSGKRITLLEPHIGQAGWIVCSKFSVESFEAEDHILFAGVRDDGVLLDPEACRRLFDLAAEASQPILAPSLPVLGEQLGEQQRRVLEEAGQRNTRWLDQEVTKLDRWSEDLKLGLEQDIKDLDVQIRETKRASTIAETLADKLVHQRALKALQTTRHQKRRDLFSAQDEVEARRDGLIADIEARMKQGQQVQPVFTIRWRLE